MLDFKNILNAWITAYRPSEEQVLLAKKRSEVCENCPSRKTITTKLDIGVICSECGCPITKKVFSSNFNECPLGKWKDVDTEFFPKQKNTSTFI